ncbi:MAG: hypothetical protein ACTSWR_03930 [Candidatus Helarchaeota archaeon]
MDFNEPYNHNYIFGIIFGFLLSIFLSYYIFKYSKNKNILKRRYNSINDVKRDLYISEKKIKIRINYFSIIKIIYISAILIIDHICWVLLDQTNFDIYFIILLFTRGSLLVVIEGGIIGLTYLAAINKLTKFRIKFLHFIKNYENNYENKIMIPDNGTSYEEFSEFFEIIKNIKRINLDQNKFIIITMIEVLIFCTIIPYFWLLPITILFFSMNNIIINCLMQIMRNLHNFKMETKKDCKNDNELYHKILTFMVHQLIFKISIFLIKEILTFLIFYDQIFYGYIFIVYPIIAVPPLIILIIEFIIFLYIISIEFISIINYKKYIMELQK